MANKPPFSSKKANAKRKRKAAVATAAPIRQISNQSNWLNNLPISSKILFAIGSTSFLSLMGFGIASLYLNSSLAPIVNQDAQKQLSNATLFVFGLGVIAIVISALFGLFIGSTLSKRIRGLEAIARQYAAGDFGATVDLGAQDEIGKLAEVFNLMTFNLAQNRQEQSSAQVEAEVQNNIFQDEISHLLDVVSELEMGDLTAKAEVSPHATGLIADTLNRLSEQLAEVLAAVLQTTQQVTIRTDRLEQLAIAVSQNAEQQEALVVQARLGIEDVNQLAQEAAQQAIAANRAVQRVRSAVRQGEEQIIYLTASIESLQAATVQMVQRIRNLGEFVALAKQFVLDQKRLASLTQVLATNASMVAARALEQRDPEQFASVAKEFEAIATQVNGLATQTNQGLVVLQQRTGFVDVVVSGIDQDVRDVNSLVSDFTTSVNSSEQSFTNIANVTEELAEIGVAVTDSSRSIAEAVKFSLASIQDIEAIAERSASQAQFTRDQSGKMGMLARQLLERVQFFRLPPMLASDLAEIDEIESIEVEKFQVVS
ncbi:MULTISPECIES: methyl-accepting chemotaxis protein [Pseudanabaena]|uniref:Methyl-accepting chemotaxis sensory transducer n=2 Tax=Pseudanabaena TaxID=1152 RepID=L8MWZ4_9CYAN|nr:MULTISPECIES: methyl-accepting chemotaxis protein [Pseudanabaena]ELS31299.1 methyl-accepting chemotaxis sensory transducer [Pseudanabaena biceps PCC 7429]MDG3496444.1 HAMP domain-containing protein [Pseudanabaena catenata USMAC16]